MSTGARNYNNFGVLRLIFAGMVVLSHAPELVDGNRSRELLTTFFHTLSFGEVGVDGFFLISGYLITKSFQSSPNVFNYLLKRIARIYPAFLVATAVSVFLFAPLSGTAMSALTFRDWQRLLTKALLLQPPPLQAFSGLHYPVLNGAMWTIAYEFRCYLLVAALGVLGILRHREFMLAGCAVFVLMLAAKVPTPIPTSDIFYGNPPEAIRMTAAFLTGSIFYLYRDVIAYRTRYAVFAAIVTFGGMFVPRLAEPVLLVFGGYLIFWIALALRPSEFSRITTETDISYGLYLYTWPIQSALVFFYRDISPWLMFALSLTLAAAFGYASWMLLERRIQQRVHRRAFDQTADPATPEPIRAGVI